MGADFKIECRISSGNLHIYPKGMLDGSSACQILIDRNKKFIEEREDCKKPGKLQWKVKRSEEWSPFNRSS